ncbi:MAG TPA: aldo/keto reductase, partial [Caulobacterales bacterium]|nr:aldo/keto reductase [Caulobacterales bacterium]
EEPPAGTRLSRPGYGQRVLSDRNLDKVEKLADFARARGRTLLDVAFGWLLSHKAISSVIAGATQPEQIEQNVAAGEYVMSEEDVAEAEKLAA